MSTKKQKTSKENLDFISQNNKNSKKSSKQGFLNYLKNCPKRYFITAFSGMAIGLFCTLIAGTIMQNIALLFKPWASIIYEFLFYVGNIAKILMGAGIGVGIAMSLKAPRMVVAGAAAAGFLGAFASSFLSPNFAVATAPGNPINSYLCALVATELGILVSGKTKVDILVVPLTALISAGIIALTLGRPVDYGITAIANGIDAATKAQPFWMSLIISISMGILLTLPTSSAAIGFSIGLNGLAAGAAVAGCCSHMIGFAVASFRENKWSGLISQGLGTSMLQIPNITRKPHLLIPAVVASAITGPLAVLVFNLHCDPAGSGMGTSGMVGVINTISESIKNGVAAYKIVLGIALCCFILPAIISFFVSELMRKKGWIKFGDLKIET